MESLLPTTVTVQAVEGSYFMDLRLMHSFPL